MIGLIYQDLIVYMKCNFSLKKLFITLCSLILILLSIKKNSIIFLQIVVPVLVTTFLPEQINKKENEVNWNMRLKALPIKNIITILSKYISIFVIFTINYMIFTLISIMYIRYFGLNVNLRNIWIFGFSINTLIAGISLFSVYIKKYRLSNILILIVCVIFFLFYINFDLLEILNNFKSRISMICVSFLSYLFFLCITLFLDAWNLNKKL